MLEQGEMIAKRQNFGNIQWRQGDSSTLRALHLPPLDLCIVGRSFHWMSREQVLADLDLLINQQSGMVIASMEPPETEWSRIVAEVRNRYLTPVGHTLDELIGLQFSHSSFTSTRLGDRKDALERDLRTAVTEFNPSGHFAQAISAEALIATRRH